MGCVDSLEPKRNWARLSRGLVAPLYEPRVFASCPTLAQADRTVFPAELAFSRIGRQRADPARCPRARMPPGCLARALNLAQKGTGGVTPWAASWSCSATNQRRTLAPAAPRRPEQRGWAVPCSEQLQASSAQQMNYHQSKCYLTRFILCVFLLHSHHTKHSKKNIV